MRPAAVYAKPTDHAQPELLALLHGQWRVATRAVMLLLSLQGWPPSAIAELLGYHPRTVRRWIGRFNQQGTAGLADRPRPGRPPVGSRRLPQRIRRLLTQTQRAWTVPLLYQYLGRPAISLRTLHRRSARSRRGDGPDWSPRATRPRPGLRAAAAGDRRAARWGGGAGRGRDHINLLPGCAPPGSPAVPASR